MGAAAIPLLVAGTAVSTYGSYQQGLAESGYYKNKANTDRIQAGLVRQQGDIESTFAQDQGARETDLLRRNVRSVEGSQAAAAAANLGGGSVTTADIVRDTFDKAKMDELAIRYNADMKSYRAKNSSNLEAYNLENEAKGYDFAKKNAKRAGITNAFSSLLGGSSQVAKLYYQGSKY